MSGPRDAAQSARRGWLMPFSRNLKLHPILSVVAWAISVLFLWPMLIAYYVALRILSQRIPRIHTISLGVWLLLLAAPLLALVFSFRPSWSSQTIALYEIIGGTASLAFTFLFGLYVGYFRLWKSGWLFVAAGTFVVMACYVVAMLATSNPNDPTVDNAAGAGIVIFVAPIALVLATVLGVGAGIATLLRIVWAKARPASRLRR